MQQEVSDGPSAIQVPPFEPSIASYSSFCSNNFHTTTTDSIGLSRDSVSIGGYQFTPANLESNNCNNYCHHIDHSRYLFYSPNNDQ